MLPVLLARVRNLGRRPGHLAVSSTVLGLGIAAVTLVFSLVESAIWADLPAGERGRLVWIGRSTQMQRDAGVSLRAFRRWRRLTSGLESLALYTDGAATLLTNGAAKPLRTTLVSAGFFETLGLRPVIGRPIQEQDELHSSEPVVVLSHGFWETEFDGDPDVIGRSIVIDGRRCIVIGVADERFSFPRPDVQAWMPLAATFAPLADIERASVAWAVGRLRRGATAGVVQRELRRADALEGGVDERAGVPFVESLVIHRTRPFASRLTLLAVAALVVLGLSVGTTAVAAMSEDIQQEREFAVHAALGASPALLRLQLVAEHLAIALAGAFIGIGLAALALQHISAVASSRLREFAVGSVSMSAFLVATLSSVVPSAGSALLRSRRIMSRSPATMLLQQGSSHTAGVGVRRRQFLVVVVEIAGTTALACSAAILLRGYMEHARTDVGMALSNVTAARIALPYRVMTPTELEAARRTADELLRALSGQPGRITAISSATPLRGSMMRSTFSPARTLQSTQALVLAVSPSFFEALGVRVLTGKSFRPTDDERSTPVAVLSRQMALEAFGDVSVSGRMLRLKELGIDVTILGVVSDTRQSGQEVDPPPIVYVRYALLPLPSFVVLVRTNEPLSAIQRDIIAVHRRLQPDQPVPEVMPGSALATSALERSAVYSMGLLIATVLGAALAVVGLFGVLSLNLRQRIREHCIRLCLGASPIKVGRGLVGQIARPVSVGMIVGIALAIGIGRLIESSFPGVSGLDVEIGAPAIAFVVGVTCVAAALPLRRLTSVSLAATLRE